MSNKRGQEWSFQLQGARIYIINLTYHPLNLVMIVSEDRAASSSADKISSSALDSIPNTDSNDENTSVLTLNSVSSSDHDPGTYPL